MENPVVLCRTCFSTKVNSYQSLSAEIINVLEECVPIKIDERLVHDFQVVICNICVTILFEFAKFKMRCIEIDPMFDKYRHNSTDIQRPNANGLVCKAEKQDVNVKFKEEFDCLSAQENVEACFDLKVKVNNARRSEHKSIRKLSRHRLMHDKKPPKTNSERCAFQCTQCNKLFRSKDGLNMHKKSTHSSDQPYACLFADCTKQFATYGLLTKHCKQGHANFAPPITCEQCTQRFYDAKRSRKHHIYQHSENCPSCGLNRSDTKNYLDHIRRCMKGQFKEPQKCNLCGRTYRHLKSFTTHMTQKHSECDKRKVCLTCGKKTYDIKNHERKHLLTNVERRFKCGFCGELFDTRVLIMEHRKQMHADDIAKLERKFECDNCHKRYLTKGTLKKHKINTHGTEFNYKCDLCERSFNSADWLKTHIKRAHTNERRHCCVHCARRFFTHAELKKHTRSHTGERPYACSKCSQTFTRNDRLKLHLLNHPV